VGYAPSRPGGVEAALKYLVLAATSAAFLLFGMALYYAAVGRMDFDIVGWHRPWRWEAEPVVIVSGLALMLVGIGFKLGVVPFHLWTPDVYQGAPAPVTALVATISKGAILALLMRLFAAYPRTESDPVILALAVIAVASMVAGNLLALLQTNVKRLLAYSSIAHLGYLLVAFLASGERGPAAATFYLVAYFITTLGAFGVVTVLSGAGRDADRLEDYRGLARRRPVLAGVFTGMLLSLAGIPLTAGFIGKFYVLAAGVGAALWMLVAVMIAASAVGIFYYLRVVIEMYKAPVEEGVEPAAAPLISVPLSLAAGVALAAMTMGLVGLGVYPAPLVGLIETIVAGLG
jgi:NADH-quinone oxidoreductase subunit N